MRLVAIDQIRGVAICAMMLAHFGPGVWERLELSGPLLTVASLVGRIATPAFIVIFGFTIPFAYIEKARKDYRKVRTKLIKRSGMVFVATLAVGTPKYVATFFGSDYWGGSIGLSLLINTYDVLLFYSIAIFVMALLIKYIANHPYILPSLLGSLLIFLGTMLGYDSWPVSEPSLKEFARLVFVSGKYGFLVNFGLILTTVSLSWHLKSLIGDQNNLSRVFFPIGIIILLTSLSVGRIVGWRTLEDLSVGYDAPPQLWYLTLILGLVFVAMATFNSIKIPFASSFLEHTGRNPLSLYVAHAFVLPSVTVLRLFVPGLPATLQIAIPMVSFLFYWLYIVKRSSREVR